MSSTGFSSFSLSYFFLALIALELLFLQPTAIVSLMRSTQILVLGISAITAASPGLQFCGQLCPIVQRVVNLSLQLKMIPVLEVQITGNM
jgi:hypothetical protein